MKRIILSVVMLIGFLSPGFGQEIPSYNYSFNNLYLINPAAAGLERQAQGFLTYHRHWMAIEGAPQSASLSFNTPTKGEKVSLGFNIYNDQRSILNSSGALLSVGYSIQFSKVSSLRFGLSGGASFSSFDMDKVVVDQEDDAALINKLNNSIAPDGNFGLFLHLNGFHAGFTMPKLFTAPILTGESMAKVELQQFDNLLFNVGWKLKIIPKAVTFHPMVTYRMNSGGINQFDGSGVINFHDAFWIGGNYKQGYGYGLLAGVKLKMISIGYAYELPSADVYKYSGASHEVQLGIYFGKKKEEKKKPVTPAVVKKPVQAKPKYVPQTTPKPVVKPQTEVKPQQPVVKPQTEVKPQQPVVKPQPEVKKEPVKTPLPAKVEPAKVEKEEVVYLPAPKKVEPPVKKDTIQKTIKYETAKGTFELPSNEKIVIASKGTHPLELQEGNYVIVGAFSVFENATRFKNQISDRGFPAQLGFNSEKKLYYVYIFSNDDVDSAIAKKNELRKIEDFKSAWLFIVE